MNQLCERLGLELPVIQSPMAGVQGHELAAAVSNAGGLGSLPGALLSPQALEKELTALKQATDRPFNVNFFCHELPEVNLSQEALWREQLAAYYQEYELNEKDIEPLPLRKPFDQEAVDVLKRFQPVVVSFHFGLPSSDLLDQVKAWGATIFASATTVDEAKWLEKQGADVVIVQGLEAGGHRGCFLSGDMQKQCGTFALLPQVVAAVDLPVVAAGGVADAQGVQAALSLGASAVQAGTVYLLCNEAKTSVLHRTAIKNSDANQTALTHLFSGRPARSLVNRVISELGAFNSATPAFPFAAGALGPLRQAAEAQGRADFTPLWCGQNASGCREISATELTRSLCEAIKSHF